MQKARALGRIVGWGAVPILVLLISGLAVALPQLL